MTLPNWSNWSSLAWDYSHQGEYLDLSTWAVDYHEDFDDPIGNLLCDVTQKQNGKLFAYGDTAYGGKNQAINPNQDASIYTTSGGDLVLKAYSTDSGAHWRQGLVQTMGPLNTGPAGRGASFRKGYWAIRGYCGSDFAWWGPWLYSDFKEKDGTKTCVEIDIEMYPAKSTSDAYNSHITAHLWAAATPQVGELAAGGHLFSPSNTIDTRKVPNLYLPNMLAATKVEHGILLTDSYIIWYCNRRELGRWPITTEIDAASFFCRMSMGVNTNAYPTDTSEVLTAKVDWIRHYSPTKSPWINGHDLFGALAWREGLQASLPAGHAYASQPPLRDLPRKSVLHKLIVDESFVEEFLPVGKRVGGTIFDIGPTSTLSVSSPNNLVAAAADGRSLVRGSAQADLSVQTQGYEDVQVTETDANAHNSPRITTVRLQLKPHPATLITTPGLSPFSFTGAASSAIKTGLRAFVDNGRDTGFWDKIYGLLMLATPTGAADGLLNIKGTQRWNAVNYSYSAVNNGCTWTKGLGYQGDGASGHYLDTYFKMGTSASHTPWDNDNHLMVYHPTNIQDASPSFGSDYCYLNPRDTSNRLVALNNLVSGRFVAEGTGADGSGVWMMERPDAASQQVYKYQAGVFAQADTASLASVFGSNANTLWICGHQGGGNTYGKRMTGAWSVGWHVGPTLAAIYAAAVKTLMDLCAAEQ